jgi:hypothetical protein
MTRDPSKVLQVLKQPPASHRNIELIDCVPLGREGYRRNTPKAVLRIFKE